MLVWLSLLLWTGTCCAMDMHGQGTLGRFETFPENSKHDINGIELYFGIAGILKGFRVRTGSEWSKVYCQKGPYSEQLLLDSDEYFVSVKGYYKVYLRSLIFSTSKSRVFETGSRQGQAFNSGSDSTGEVLTSIGALCGTLGVSLIGFDWKYPLDVNSNFSTTKAPKSVS